jgi:hypothetical protein
MTEEHKKMRLAQLRHELKAFEAEAIRAESSAAKRHAADRADSLRAVGGALSEIRRQCEFTLQLGALRTDFNVQSAALRDEIKSLKGWRNAIT